MNSQAAGVTVFLMLVCMSWNSFAERLEEKFSVKPGAGTLSEEKQLVVAQLGKFKCKFTYKAQGGTGEDWSMTIVALEEAPDVHCTVQRRSSYLFFEDFELELTGPDVSIDYVDVMAAQMSGERLKPEEYIHGPTSVSSVKGSFKNRLDKVSVYAHIKFRDDL